VSDSRIHSYRLGRSRIGRPLPHLFGTGGHRQLHLKSDLIRQLVYHCSNPVHLDTIGYTEQSRPTHPSQRLGRLKSSSGDRIPILHLFQQTSS